MAHAPTPPTVPSAPVAATVPDAARPDDAARAWAFLSRRTAWEHRLDSLRRDAGTLPVAPSVTATTRHTEAA